MKKCLASIITALSLALTPSISRAEGQRVEGGIDRAILKENVERIIDFFKNQQGLEYKRKGRGLEEYTLNDPENKYSITICFLNGKFNFLSYDGDIDGKPGEALYILDSGQIGLNREERDSFFIGELKGWREQKEMTEEERDNANRVYKKAIEEVCKDIFNKEK